MLFLAGTNSIISIYSFFKKVNAIISIRLVGQAKRKMLRHTDNRTAFLEQILKGIEVLKLSNWEAPVLAQLKVSVFDC